MHLIQFDEHQGVSCCRIHVPEETTPSFIVASSIPPTLVAIFLSKNSTVTTVRAALGRYSAKAAASVSIDAHGKIILFAGALLGACVRDALDMHLRSPQVSCPWEQSSVERTLLSERLGSSQRLSAVFMSKTNYHDINNGKAKPSW